MKILALEFSASERSVAIAEHSAGILALVTERDFRGVTGLSLIDRALKEAGISPAEISRIALGLGPGSYTGIRSSIAIAQGWQLGCGVELAGISSALGIAREAQVRGFRGEIGVVIDAQRMEVYLARYEIGDRELRETEPLQIVPAAEIGSDIALIGPGASKLIPGAIDLAPSAAMLARLVMTEMEPVPGENLEPIYLRQTTFAKAPAPRHIP